MTRIDKLDCNKAWNKFCARKHPKIWHKQLLKSGCEYSSEYGFHYYDYADKSGIVLREDDDGVMIFWETIYPPLENLINLNQYKSETIHEYTDRLRAYKKELPHKKEDITVICEMDTVDQMTTMKPKDAITCVDLTLKVVAT